MTAKLTRLQAQLVEDNMALARSQALGMWRSNGGDRDELVSLAYMGLIEAASRYEPSVGPFENFAKRRIRGSILDAARSADHVPRSVRTRYKAGDMSVAGEVEAKPVHIDEAIADALTDTDPALDQQVENSQITVYASQLIGSLPDDQQVVLALHYYAGVELKEIASLFGVPVSRVGQMHIKAVLALSELVRARL